MSAAPLIRAVSIAHIDVSDRLRPLHPGAVAAYAEEHGRGGRWAPIRVVERGDGYKLVFGLQRIGAAAELGLEMIEAEVFVSAAYPTDAAIRLDEIRENFLRHELTKLDRAVHLATWKAIYEAENQVAKHGGRRENSGRKSSDKTVDLKSVDLKPQPAPDAFVQRFSVAAAQFLDVSEISVRRAVEIAEGIGADVRARIAFAAIANNASDLALLARQTPERQQTIVGLLLCEPPAAASVAEAIAAIDGVSITALAGWERVSDRFAQLKPADQHAFFAAHHDAFVAWLAERDRPRRKAG